MARANVLFASSHAGYIIYQAMICVLQATRNVPLDKAVAGPPGEPQILHARDRTQESGVFKLN